MNPSQPDVEVLEPRLLYSADVFALVDSSDAISEETVVMPFARDDGSTDLYEYNVDTGGAVTTAQYPANVESHNSGLFLRELPTSGTLLLDGTPMVLNDVVSDEDVTGGLLVYQHDGSASALDTALFQYEHNGHSHDNWVRINLNVSSLNNPAVLVDDTVVYTGTSGTVDTTTLLSNDTDADGHALVITGFEQPNAGSLNLTGTDQLSFTQPDSNTTDNAQYEAGITVRELDSSYLFALPLIMSNNELVDDRGPNSGYGPLSSDGSGATFSSVQDGLDYGAFSFPDSFEISIEVNAESISQLTSNLLYSVGRAADTGSITVYTAAIGGKDYLIAHMGGDGSLPNSESDLNASDSAVMYVELDNSYFNAWHTVGLTVDSNGIASLLLDNAVVDTKDVSGVAFGGNDFHVGNDIFFTYSRPFDGHLRNLFVRDLDGLGTTSPAVNESDSTVTFRRFGDALSVAQDDSYTLAEDGTISSATGGVDSLAENDSFGTSATVSHTWVLVEDGVNGTATVNADGSFSYTQSAPTRSADHFEYSLISEYTTLSGDSWSTESTVHVDLDASAVVLGSRPVAVDDNLTVDEGGSVVLTDSNATSLLDNDTDADGDTLMVVSVINPVYGSLTVDPDGTFSYVHGGSENFSDQFSYTIVDENNDAAAAPATVYITINPVNDNIPVAVGDAMSVDYGGVATALTGGAISLLDNDSDLDTADILRAEVVVQATRGTVTINADGTFSYAHDGSLGGGTDTFRYRAIDDAGQAAVADVIVTIGSNSAPSVSDDTLYLDEGATAFLTSGGAASLLDNDADPDGHSLVVVSHTSATHGTVNVGADGSFSYVHDGSENFSDEFRYTLQDEFGSAAPVEGVVRITIEPVNENAPAVIDDELEVDFGERQSVLIGGQLSLLHNDSDSDTADTLVARLETAATKGTVTVNSDGTFEYIHGGGAAGIDTFSYTVSDAEGNETTGTVQVTVHPEDLAPQFLSGSGDLVVHEGVSDSSELSAFFKDEGSVNYAVVRGQESFFAVDPDTGTLTIDPSSADVGTHTFRVRVTDAAGQYTDADFTVVVLPLDTASTTEPPPPDTAVETVGTDDNDSEDDTAAEEATDSSSANGGDSDTESTEQFATEFIELWNHLSSSTAGAADDVEIDQVAIHRGDSNGGQSYLSDARDAGLLAGSGAGLSLSSLLDAADSPETGALIDVDRSSSSNALGIDTSSTVSATVTTATAATGFSLGYLLWLARSGFLLSTVLSALPAWRNIDPLPVLGSLSDKADDDDPDDKSLSEMTERD